MASYLSEFPSQANVIYNRCLGSKVLGEMDGQMVNVGKLGDPMKKVKTSFSNTNGESILTTL